MSGNPEKLRQLAITQRKSSEQFLEDARKTHGDKYQYPDLSDTRARSKIRILCQKHGEFLQTVTNHINGNGCPLCSRENSVGRKVAPYIKPNRRTSNETWLSRFREKHGNRYQYPDLVDPNFSMTTRTKFRVVCPDHGVSYQLVTNHLRGCGCNACGLSKTASYKPSNTRTSEEFINQANSLHNSKYQYPDLSDVRSKTLIRIVCPIHGEFLQQVEDHLRGGGCRICANVGNAMVRKLTPEIIMERLKQSQGERYDWYEYPSDITERMSHDRITVYCKRHKSTFSPTLGSLLEGSGCPKCALGIEPLNIDPRDVRPGRRTVGRMTWELFMERARLIHGSKYSYTRPDESEWKGVNTRITIRCSFHGDFVQQVGTHIGQGSGCPKCKASKGERLVGSILEKSGIPYEFQKTFPDLVGDGGRPLRLDFYIPSIKVAIEYDGDHHARPVTFGTVSDTKAEKNHVNMKRSDMQKEKYAKANGISIVRILEGEAVESIADKLEAFGMTFPIDSGIRIPPPNPESH
jgi:hypothetical protein